MQFKTIIAAAAMLGATTALAAAQNPTGPVSKSSKEMSGGGEGSTGGSGSGAAVKGTTKAGSADSGNNGSANGAMSHPRGSGRGKVTARPDPSKGSGRPLGTSGPKENRN
jgi:hypothetical protein